MVPDEKKPRINITEAQEALLREILGQVAGKWPLVTMHVLADNGGPLRFARLLERVEGISQKMLTQTLRHLERNGLVTRTVYADSCTMSSLLATVTARWIQRSSVVRSVHVRIFV